MLLIEEIYNGLYNEVSNLVKTRDFIIKSQNTMFAAYYFYNTHSGFQKEKENITSLIEKSKKLYNNNIKDLKEVRLKIDKLPKYYRHKLFKLIYND